MPTPKQMEKMAYAAAADRNMPPAHTPGPGDEMPPEGLAIIVGVRR